jgi:hypothetical protein
MVREYMQHPEDIPVDTSIGRIYLNPTSGTHVFVNVKKLHGPNSDEEPLVLRSIPYHVTAHVYLIADPTSGEGTWTFQDRHSLYMTRRDPAHLFEDASEPARRDVGKVIVEAVQGWAGTYDSATALAEADIADANNELRRQEQEVEELAEKLSTATARAELMQQRLIAATSLRDDLIADMLLDQENDRRKVEELNAVGGAVIFSEPEPMQT